MHNATDQLPPAPTSMVGKRFMELGNFNFLVNGRRGIFIANQNDFFLGFALIHYGECSEHEWYLLQQILRPDAIVVEVGSHIGTHTVPLAKLVGSGGRVIAIEPQRVLHQHLNANISLNGLLNVESYQCGCGERAGIMSVPPVDYFAAQRNNFGAIALQPEGRGEPVKIRALDDIIGARPVQLIKIDVEGMEAEVLRGAKKTIRKYRPFLYVENDRADKSETLITLLRHYGYRSYWHTPSLFNPLNFFEQTENIYGPAYSVNMFCVPNEVTMDMHQFQEVKDPREHPHHAFRR